MRSTNRNTTTYIYLVILLYFFPCAERQRLVDLFPGMQLPLCRQSRCYHFEVCVCYIFLLLLLKVLMYGSFGQTVVSLALICSFWTTELLKLEDLIEQLKSVEVTGLFVCCWYVTSMCKYVSGQWKSRDCLCRVLYVCVTSIGFHCMYVSSSVCLCHEYYLLVTRFFKIHGLYKHFNHKYWLPFSPSHNTTSFLSFSQLLFSTNKS